MSSTAAAQTGGAPGGAGLPTALSVQGLSVSYGGVRALVDAHLEVKAGQLVSLIGPNGAGKTTFIDAVSGFVPYRGKVSLGDEDLNGKSAHTRARLGLARTWQSIELFDDLSVRENLSVASRRPSLLKTLGEMCGYLSKSTSATDEVLEILGLGALAESFPSDLAQGQRKLVGIARALVSRPKVLCLDEPAAGLNTQESEQLGRRLRNIVAAGTPVLLVDHDMGLVLGISDHVIVLEFGQVIASGSCEEVRHDPRVIAAYLGGAGELDSASVDGSVDGSAAGHTGTGNGS
jgi:branched-chain amino acid transport system ATP-binding protein